MNEKDLIRAAKTGDKEAFASLYMLYRDRLYRYAYYRLGNEENARDAVSGCIVEAYESIGSLLNEKAFPAWIFRILYRTCSAQLREQTRGGGSEELEALELPDTEKGFVQPELDEALAILSPEDREIVLLSAVAGYNSREISTLTGLKPVTVRSRLSRSLAKLREFLS